MNHLASLQIVAQIIIVVAGVGALHERGITAVDADFRRCLGV